MKPDRSTWCLDCQATDNALARRVYQRRVAVITAAAALLVLLLILATR